MVLNLESLVVRAGDMFGVDWNECDPSTLALAGQIRSLFALLDGFGPDARAQMVSLYIEERMSLDLDDTGADRLAALVREQLSHE